MSNRSKEMAMLTMQDCLDYAGMEAEAVCVICARERVPMMEALEMADALMASREGLAKLHCMMLDEICRECSEGRLDRALSSRMAYEEFSRAHPMLDENDEPIQATRMEEA